MNALDLSILNNRAAIDAAIDAACRAVAPSWPLDEFIAVNPYWGRIDRPFAAAGLELQRLSGSSFWMPHGYFREAWRQGRVSRAALAEALAEAGSSATPEQLVAALDEPQPAPVSLPLLSDVLDAARDLGREPSWRETITHQVSQFCAAWFDREQADWRPPAAPGLYAGWRDAMTGDHAVELLMHAPGIARRAGELPVDARTAIALAVARLGIGSDQPGDLLQTALLRINGWAAWCAYLRWQARLEGGDDDHITELLAIRLAWECLLDDGERRAGSVWARWQVSWAAAAPAPLPVTALWQRAAEIDFQRPLASALAGPVAEAGSQVPVMAHAVFCIDVRSEVFRRALETVDSGVRTSGFAGFFGLPIRYRPLGTGAARPQLPGLLAPALDATDSCDAPQRTAALAGRRQARLNTEAAWQPFKRLPASAFTLVESLGLSFAGRLIGRSFARTGEERAPHRHGLSRDEQRHVRPRLAGIADAQAGADLAARVLGAMGLGTALPRLVLLIGHGSQSANNPHAAGLDCGACGGQTGEVNARALAALLNDAAVRERLAARARAIPAETRFLPGLHNTTTDEVVLFDTDLLPSTHAGDLRGIARVLAAAGERARAERAAALGLGALAAEPRALARRIAARANDWSQTRPEWGLANNAAFVVAPRARSRDIDLAGRAFLHDYDWRSDADGSVLELIMTAPMIVTHWINMQYYASSVDHLRYGSGNKVLHNVVGGRIGVFEGNGGDLRIGLPLQSVHDGAGWMHTPLRLSVFIEAPAAAIDAVIAKHEFVHKLLDNGWLHLFRIGDAAVERRAAGGWQHFADAAGK